MNIGITVYPTYGGSGIVGSELGKELAARGHTVHFISSALPTRLTELNERVRFHEVEMMSYPLFEHQPYTLALATKMAKVAETENLDLLHVHYAIPHSISAILARESLKPNRRLPVITTLHGTDITLVGADRSYLPITRYGIVQSDGVTAISHYLKNATKEIFQFDDITVIPNFVCASDYHRHPVEELRKTLAPNGEPLLVHVSNFRPVKRPVDCVDIFARVLKKVTNVRLVMVGDGSERMNVEHRAQCLGIHEKCSFVGKQPNIVDYLSASDVLLLPSEQESFGLAALEAMACEVPVIASRVGGIPEVVTDGETGFLSEVGDIEKMAEDAARLLADADLRQNMGRRARESALSRYRTDIVIPQYIQFYETVLAKSSGKVNEDHAPRHLIQQHRLKSMLRSIIVGTAGHIDHGKSALVRALTGMDPDRLPEEKRRGITIDLGFADLELGGLRIGFVDVPGHERFVKNMLAGAHGIDVVALVIAADEGVMPQTREHFDICRLLGVQTGLIVITKTDLVEEELITLVRDEAQELVAGSFLDGAPMLAASAKTGAGLDELKEALQELAGQVPVRPTDSVSRLAVDRAFTMKGFGAVITGTLVTGEIAEGAELELLPSLARVRARGLQVHGTTVRQATAGQRTAVNLGGIDTAMIERGMVLAPTGRLRATQIIDAHLSVLPNAARALRSRARVRLHIHAAEVLARVQVLSEGGQLAPGDTGFVQLRLEAPIVAVAGERFIIRSNSPSQTMAGGLILDPFAAKHRGRDLAQVRQRLEKLMVADGADRVSLFVESSGNHGQRLADLAARTGWNDATLTQTLIQAKQSGAVVECEGVFVSTVTFQLLKQAAMDDVNEHHRQEPLARGAARETLRERRFAYTPPEVFRAVLLALEQEGALVSDRDMVRAHSHTVELSAGDAELRDRLAQVYENADLEPPSLDEAMHAAMVSSPQKNHGRKVLQLLIDGQTLIRVQGEYFFHRKALDKLIARLKEFGDQHEPGRTIDVPTFKDLAGVSRKYAIPLLEFLDRERITRREGDRRAILR